MGSSIRDSPLLADLPESDVARQELIARFGVGFVTTFAVADRVEVITRKPEMTPLRVSFQGSDDQNGFSETNITLEATDAQRLGTTVIVWLKEPLTADELRNALTYFVRGWDSRNTRIIVGVCTGMAIVWPTDDSDTTYVPIERKLVADRSIELHPSANGEKLVVLQDGILVESGADDLLPKEVAGLIAGNVNVPPGIMELLGARNKFRRTKASLTHLREVFAKNYLAY